MLSSRLKVVIIILPIAIAFIAIGGWIFTALIGFMVGMAAWEFWRMFKGGNYAPSAPILVGGSVLLVLSRHLWGFQYSDIIFVFLILVAMGYHTLTVQKEQKTSGLDFAITVSGVFYIGWLGSYLVSLRNLPNGMWWILLAIPTIALGDAGAYFVGRHFGKHKLAPHVSPQKTVEGYFGGIAAAILGGLLLAALWKIRFTQMPLAAGLILGGILGTITPLGDLGESMLKRQFGLKDTGVIFPGHGGMLDRLDSWLWGAAISYYLIIWLW